jgi:hypothetical protein
MIYSYEMFRLMQEGFVTATPAAPREQVRRTGSARVPAGPTNRLRRRRR